MSKKLDNTLCMETMWAVGLKTTCSNSSFDPQWYVPSLQNKEYKEHCIHLEDGYINCDNKCQSLVSESQIELSIIGTYTENK